MNYNEKEPLTLEKDNEDQIKFYLSYPKLPVLDMKWKNHDINVAEWANIPNLGENVVLRPMVCYLQLLNLIYL